MMKDQYSVVVNDEMQYSIWPEMKPLPGGWKKEGFQGAKESCLEHINKVWTDMRPLSLRKKLEDMALNPSSYLKETKIPQDDLVDRLCQKQQPVKLDPQVRDIADILKCIDQSFIYIEFSQIEGGTIVGVQIKNFSKKVDESGKEKAFIDGYLNLNFTDLELKLEVDLLNMNANVKLWKKEK